MTRQRSSAEIAAELGCSGRAVRAALQRWAIPMRSRAWPMRHPMLADPATLRRLYIDEGQTIAAIAATVGCSAGTVSNALRRHGIASHRAEHLVRAYQGKRDPRLNDRAWLETAYTVPDTTYASLAADLGCSVPTVKGALVRLGIPRQKRRSADRQPG